MTELFFPNKKLNFFETIYWNLKKPHYSNVYTGTTVENVVNALTKFKGNYYFIKDIIPTTFDKSFFHWLPETALAYSRNNVNQIEFTTKEEQTPILIESLIQEDYKIKKQTKEYIKPQRIIIPLVDIEEAMHIAEEGIEHLIIASKVYHIRDFANKIMTSKNQSITKILLEK